MANEHYADVMVSSSSPSYTNHGLATIDKRRAYREIDTIAKMATLPEGVLTTTTDQCTSGVARSEAELLCGMTMVVDASITNDTISVCNGGPTVVMDSMDSAPYVFDECKKDALSPKVYYHQDNVSSTLKATTIVNGRDRCAPISALSTLSRRKRSRSPSLNLGSTTDSGDAIESWTVAALTALGDSANVLSDVNEHKVIKSESEVVSDVCERRSNENTMELNEPIAELYGENMSALPTLESKYNIRDAGKIQERQRSKVERKKAIIGVLSGSNDDDTGYISDNDKPCLQRDEKGTGTTLSSLSSKEGDTESDNGRSNVTNPVDIEVAGDNNINRNKYRKKPKVKFRMCRTCGYRKKGCPCFAAKREEREKQAVVAAAALSENNVMANVNISEYPTASKSNCVTSRIAACAGSRKRLKSKEVDLELANRIDMSTLRNGEETSLASSEATQTSTPFKVSLPVFGADQTIKDALKRSRQVDSLGFNNETKRRRVPGGKTELLPGAEVRGIVCGSMNSGMIVSVRVDGVQYRGVLFSANKSHERAVSIAREAEVSRERTRQLYRQRQLADAAVTKQHEQQSKNNDINGSTDMSSVIATLSKTKSNGSTVSRPRRR